MASQGGRFFTAQDKQGKDGGGKVMCFCLKLKCREGR